MEQIITTTVVTLISGAIGAIIGTYGGALFAAKRQEKHIKELRQVAIKALKIFQKYARNKQTYDVAASEFNNALSIAEKRVFIVALHKLGIPILATPDSKFDIQNIVFEKREIDKARLPNLGSLAFCVYAVVFTAPRCAPDFRAPGSEPRDRPRAATRWPCCRSGARR